MNKVVPRIYVVTSKCGSYAWITSSSRFEKRTLGANAKVFCGMINNEEPLSIFIHNRWEMRWYKVTRGTKAAFARMMEKQLKQNGYIVIK